MAADKQATCLYCQNPATHRCELTGAPLCWGHARVAVVSADRSRTASAACDDLAVMVAGPQHQADLAQIMLDFWGKTDNMLTFDRAWDMLAQPAVVAYCGERLAGALVWAPLKGRGLILDLSVYPDSQASGVAARLFALAEEEMRKAGLVDMVLSTTNDNLPALHFYQRRGFIIEQVLTGVSLAHHEASGEPETGFAGIPVRDEFRLAKPL